MRQITPKVTKESLRADRPKLTNRPTCKTYHPESGCWDCGHMKFRYYNSVFGKKYYQCENCRAINH